MNTVEPIRDKELIEDIIDYFRGRSDRNALLFMFGIYSGLRISDILHFRVRDVRGKKYFVIIEQKTKKERRIPIHKMLRKEIEKYVSGKKDYEMLFKSRQGINKPITRQQAYNIIQQAAEEFGIERLGTHTMRKTFGYNLYKQTGDIVLVQKILNHATPEITLAYIGITSETMENAIMSLDY